MEENSKTTRQTNATLNISGKHILHSIILTICIAVSFMNTVRHGENATQIVDLTRIRVIVFLNSRSYVPTT
jgi:hypothetical protein